MTGNNSATWEKEFNKEFGETWSTPVTTKKVMRDCDTSDVIKYIKQNFYHKSEAVPREALKKEYNYWKNEKEKANCKEWQNLAEAKETVLSQLLEEN